MIEESGHQSVVRQAGAPHRCDPGRRCVVCHWLERDERIERFLFAGVLLQDDEMVDNLRRLSSLFFDAGAPEISIGWA